MDDIIVIVDSFVVDSFVVDVVLVIDDGVVTVISSKSSSIAVTKGWWSPTPTESPTAVT